jgi:multicomponent Na+:H+ antiporter subunit E
VSLQYGQPTPAGTEQWLRRGAPRATLFALLWWILTEGDSSSWGVGIPVIVAATIMSVTLLPYYRWRWRFLGLMRFIPFFLWQSWSGSVDVARRALSPRLPLTPRFLAYRLRLTDSSARVFFVNVVSLLPGTVSVELRDEQLIVHALDSKAAVLDELQLLEGAVAALFGADIMTRAVREGQFHA